MVAHTYNPSSREANDQKFKTITKRKIS
jgi:hypothetical protein